MVWLDLEPNSQSPEPATNRSIGLATEPGHITGHVMVLVTVAILIRNFTNAVTQTEAILPITI